MIFLASIIGAVTIVFVVLVASFPLRSRGFDRVAALLAALFATPIASIAMSLLILRPDGNHETGLAIVLGVYASVPGLAAGVIAAFLLRNIAHRVGRRLFESKSIDLEDTFE
ncbi:MAG: hypothetical protein H6919_10675 [Sphingomonadaceae bacterium]|nr:hypothetical protein [Sphingomonadaceae bacterium]MCP5383758.1 hypothetical protein [Altererythrobacter sp.]MCP5394358.1 hypothetical protein [Sphingomonadaceae bacterium]